MGRAIALEAHVMCTRIREIHRAHRGAREQLDAPLADQARQVVLEHAAIDLVARRAEVIAGAELGDGVDVLAPFGKEEPEAEFLEMRFTQMLAEPDHVREIVGADLDGRLAHLVRGRRHREPVALDDRDGKRGCSRAQLQREREAGESAAEDDDVARAHGRGGATRNRSARPGDTTEITSDWAGIELTTHKLITVQIGSAITEIPNYNWSSN